MAHIHPSAIIEEGAQLGNNVTVGPFSIVGKNVRVGQGTRIHSSVVLDGWTEIGEENEIFPGAVIGVAPQDVRYSGQRSYTKLGARNVIREYVTIHRATDEDGTTLIGDENLIMAYSHIAHNCILGNQIIVANSVGMAGHVEVDDQAVIGGMTGIHQFVRIGRLAMVGGMSKARQDVPPFAMVDGGPARIFGMNVRGMKRRGIPKESRRALKLCYKLLMDPANNLSQALEAMKAEMIVCPETEQLLDFLSKPSRMGVCRALEVRKGAAGKVKVEAAGG